MNQETPAVGTSPASTPELMELRRRILEDLRFINLCLATLIHAARLTWTEELYANDDKLKTLFADVQQQLRSFEGSADRLKQILSEILLCRHVDSFEYYLVGLLTRIYSSRPDMLKGIDRKLSVKELFECIDLDEAKRRAIDSQVIELGFKGLSDLLEYLRTRHGLKPSIESLVLNRAKQAIEIRHLIVHNGSRVSGLFIARTGRRDVQVGDLFPVTSDVVNDGGEALFDLAAAIDAAAIEHFGLSV